MKIAPNSNNVYETGVALNTLVEVGVKSVSYPAGLVRYPKYKKEIYFFFFFFSFSNLPFLLTFSYI